MLKFFADKQTDSQTWQNYMQGGWDGGGRGKEKLGSKSELSELSAFVSVFKQQIAALCKILSAAYNILKQF